MQISITLFILSAETQWTEVSPEYLATDIFWRTWHLSCERICEPSYPVSWLQGSGGGQPREKPVPWGQDGTAACALCHGSGVDSPVCRLCSSHLATLSSCSPEQEPWPQARLSIGSSRALPCLSVSCSWKGVIFFSSTILQSRTCCGT